MSNRKDVQLHSHDFEWADLARECQQQQKDELSKEAAEVVDGLEWLRDAPAGAAKTQWDVFHQKNNGKVYKPRNYLVKEFPELLATHRHPEPLRVLELGCGYGSAIFPILDECPHVHASVCDFSAHAISILKQNPHYDPQRCHAFVCDIAQEELNVAPESIDVVLMVFVLSALAPDSFTSTMRKVFDVLRPGGVVCFRDYGLYDLAMRRNAKQLAPSLYYRSDGTLAYFFSREDLEQLFVQQTGLRMLDNEYCTVRLKNRKKNVVMDRVWLHAKAQKPPSIEVHHQAQLEASGNQSD